MPESKKYKCTFSVPGGRNGEVDYDGEAAFLLTEEEHEAAVKVLGEHRNLDPELPEVMYDAVLEAVREALYPDIAEYHLWDIDDPEELIPGCEDMSTEEIVGELRSDRDLFWEFFDWDWISEYVIIKRLEEAAV